MPSSKFPRDVVLVPDSVLELELEHPVVCNRRAPQREDSRSYLPEDWWMDRPPCHWLARLLRNTKVAFLFQSYGTEIGTAVVSLSSVYWAEGSFPRLDFEHPPKMGELYRCPNFWGALVLAIAQVAQDAEVGTWEDGDASRFIDLVREAAIPQTSTTTFGSIPVGDCFVDAHDGEILRRLASPTETGWPQSHRYLLAEVVATGEKVDRFRDSDAVDHLAVVAAPDPEA